MRQGGGWQGLLGSPLWICTVDTGTSPSLQRTDPNYFHIQAGLVAVGIRPLQWPYHMWETGGWGTCWHPLQECLVCKSFEWILRTLRRVLEKVVEAGLKLHRNNFTAESPLWPPIPVPPHTQALFPPAPRPRTRPWRNLRPCKVSLNLFDAGQWICYMLMTVICDWPSLGKQLLLFLLV